VFEWLFQLLGWLAEKLPSSKKLPPEFGECVPHLFTCLEDRNADVRKKAHDAVLPFMIQTGYDAMVRHAAKVKVIIVIILLVVIPFEHIVT
jgi:cytoskeleton-associated protein 5